MSINLKGYILPWLAPLVCIVIDFYSLLLPTQYAYLILAVLLLLTLRFRYFFYLFAVSILVYTIYVISYGTLLSYILKHVGLSSPKPVILLIYTYLFGLVEVGIRKYIFSRDWRTTKIERQLFLVLNISVLGSFLLYYYRLNYEPYFLILECILVAIGFRILGFKVQMQYKIVESHKVIICFCIVGICVPISHFCYYKFESKTNRLALIECFNSWATSDVSYSEKDWTLKSNYSYSQLKDYLAQRNDFSLINKRTDFKDLRENYDTILLITPTTPFSQEERQELLRFIEEGGKAVFITDHTDLFGHGRVINSLLDVAGIEVRYDAIFNPQKRQDFLPVLSNNDLVVRPLTANSVTSSYPHHVIAWGLNSVSEMADYTRPNFFGELTWSADDLYGDWQIGLAQKYGKGLIVVWCDSTMFSNFALFMPDTLKLVNLLTDYSPLRLQVYVAPIYCYTIIVMLLLSPVFIMKGKGDKLLLAMCLASLVVNGIFNFEAPIVSKKEDGQFFEVYSRRELLLEPVPGTKPSELGVSNLYSNLSRFGIYPIWKGEKPSIDSKSNALWITTAEEYSAALAQGGLIPKYCVIVDDNPGELEKLGFRRQNVDTKTYQVINLSNEVSDKFYYVDNQRLKAHTKLNEEKSLFIGAGIINDTYLGDWWTTMDVSPYRKIVINQVIKWIKYQEPITAFEYPKVGIMNGEAKIIKVDKKGRTEIQGNITDYFKYQGKDYVYFGQAIWGLKVEEGTRKFILIGPETSDNYNLIEKERIIFELMDSK